MIDRLRAKSSDAVRRIRFRLENISKTYRRNAPAALDGVTLNIYENQVNAIVGASGAGKSTLCRVLLRLEKFDSGRMYFQGTDWEKIPLKEFRRKNQIAFQNPYLSVNPYFTVGKIVSEPLRIAGISRETIVLRMKELFALLEISENLRQRHPGSLSGGQLQRVVLARALALEPEFLVMDEPFSAVDDILASRLLLLFSEIFRKRGIGVLYVSHDLRRIRTIADHVSLLHRGRVIEHQDRESFFASPLTPWARRLIART
jgi:ABC-type glutathione transport system ATPase component